MISNEKRELSRARTLKLPSSTGFRRRFGGMPVSTGLGARFRVSSSSVFRHPAARPRPSPVPRAATPSASASLKRERDSLQPRTPFPSGYRHRPCRLEKQRPTLPPYRYKSERGLEFLPHSKSGEIAARSKIDLHEINLLDLNFRCRGSLNMSFFTQRLTCPLTFERCSLGHPSGPSGALALQEKKAAQAR